MSRLMHLQRKLTSRLSTIQRLLPQHHSCQSAMAALCTFSALNSCDKATQRMEWCSWHLTTRILELCCITAGMPSIALAQLHTCRTPCLAVRGVTMCLWS